MAVVPGDHAGCRRCGKEVWRDGEKYATRHPLGSAAISNGDTRHMWIDDNPAVFTYQPPAGYQVKSGHCY